MAITKEEKNKDEKSGDRVRLPNLKICTGLIYWLRSRLANGFRW